VISVNLSSVNEGSYVSVIETSFYCLSRDSSVGIVTGYGLDDRMIGVPFLAGAGNFFSSPPRTDRLVAYPASYPMGTGVSFPGGKASGV
jgi:hypothetical protein